MKKVAILTPNLRNYPWGSIMELDDAIADEMLGAGHAVLVTPAEAPAVEIAVEAPADDEPAPTVDEPPVVDGSVAKKK